MTLTAYQHIGFDLQTLFSRLVNKDSHIVTPFFAVLSESLSQPQLVGGVIHFYVCLSSHSLKVDGQTPFPIRIGISPSSFQIQNDFHHFL